MAAARQPLILLVHGPNLNLLGERKPDVYGTTTLADIEADVVAGGKAGGANVECFQSNHEGALIDFLHENRKRASGVIINAGAYTHTSVALRDEVRRDGVQTASCGAQAAVGRGWCPRRHRKD